MSDEYNYKFPDSKSFIYTLRLFLEEKQEFEIYRLLQGAECSFESTGSYSRIRWNTIDAVIRFTVLMQKLTSFHEELKGKLLEYANNVFPRNAGYELSYIEISPFLSPVPTNQILASESVGLVLQHARYKPIWGEPSNNDDYECDVFMIMPFHEELYKVYTDVVKPTVESLGLSINRGDDPFTDKEIMYDVWSMLNACKLVIADCTGRNPNVFYELGIAHTLGKPVIMLTQDIEGLPFDVSGKRAIEYNITFHQIDKLKTQLEKAIVSILPNKDNDEDFEIPF